MSTLKGAQLLQEPTETIDEAFPLEKRDLLGIRGLIPPHVLTPELQEQRFLAEFDKETDSMKKFLLLSDLSDRNTHLYYYIVIRHFAKLAPFIYTPHVGAYCQHYHEIYRPKRCLYYSLDDENHIDDITAAWPSSRVDVVVVTDGGRILGLGDLGCNGIGIPIGKLALYCAGAGSDPRYTLPVQIDVGTNNVALRENPLYMGLHKPRTGGVPYRKFVEKVLLSLHKRFPDALIQFEDFGIENAFDLLQEWRDRILSFNDDIQGTGAVALSAVINAQRARGKTLKDLVHDRIVIAGAGSAAIGIADAIVAGLVMEGVPKEEAQKIFYIHSVEGLVGKDSPIATPQQKPYQRQDLPYALPLLETVKAVKPTFLLGVSGAGPLFTEEIVRIAAQASEKPIIMPMSNPTHKAECTLEQAAKWTDGKVIFASGSPFGDIKYVNKSGEEVLVKGNQCNNMYIFPALGLAASKAHATKVSDGMLYAASLSLAKQVSEEDAKKGILLPSLEDPRQFSLEIATDVVLQALKEEIVLPDVLKQLGCSSTDRNTICAWLNSTMYRPERFFNN